MKKTVLITGVNGFIGSHTARYFKTKGYCVVGIDLCEKQNNDYVIKKLDLLNDNLAEMLMEIKPEIIIHCAGCASVGYSIMNPAQDYSSNVTVVHRILFAMKECRMENSRFILLSSAAVYGQPEMLPIREEFKFMPLSPYALHKVFAEEICMYFNRVYGFDIKILRVFSAYGPGLKKQIFWDMAEKIRKTGKLELFGTGNESRDFIYIDDLMECVWLVATCAEQKYSIYNIANGKEITIRHAAEIFLAIRKIDLDLLSCNNVVREGDPLNWCADISRIHELGYRQTVNIEQGIEKYLEWSDSEEEKLK